MAGVERSASVEEVEVEEEREEDREEGVGGCLILASVAPPRRGTCPVLDVKGKRPGGGLSRQNGSGVGSNN